MFLGIFGNLLIFLRRKEVADMAVIYVALIIKGKRDFKSVPSTVKEKVREMLVDLEMEELIVE
jgi:hypothetical protein